MVFGSSDREALASIDFITGRAGEKATVGRLVQMTAVTPAIVLAINVVASTEIMLDAKIMRPASYSFETVCYRLPQLFMWEPDPRRFTL